VVPFPFERLLDPDSIPALYLAVLVAPVLFVWRGRRLAWLVAVLGCGACVVQVLHGQADRGLLDLEIYVGAAETWVSGGSIYGFRDPVHGLGSTYPPVASLLFAPLAPLGALARELLWTAANVAMLATACRVVATRLLGLRGEAATSWTLFATGMAAVTVPVWISVAYQGQVNVLLWLLVVADVGTVGRRSRWTGVGIGVATALKLVPGLFVVWLVAVGERRGAGRAVGVAVGLTALGAALALSDSRAYWTELLWDSGRVGDVADVQNNSLLGALSRVLDPSTLRTGCWLALGVVIVGMALVRARRATRAGDLLTSTVVVGCAASLVSPISWTHHLGFLVLALAALAPGGSHRTRPVLVVAAWVALMDPVGFGTDASTSTLRMLAMVALVVAMPVVPGRSRPAPVRAARSDGGAAGPSRAGGSGGDDAQYAVDELSGAVLEVRPLDGHAADHVGPAAAHDVAQLVEGRSGIDGIGAEHRAGLAGDERQLGQAARLGRALADEEQPVGPAAHDHEVGVGHGLVVHRGGGAHGGAHPFGDQALPDQLGGPGGVAGEALVDDDGAHGPDAPSKPGGDGRA
jgi:alpha-1,2-mannosyltransferase